MSACGTQYRRACGIRQGRCHCSASRLRPRALPVIRKASCRRSQSAVKCTSHTCPEPARRNRRYHGGSQSSLGAPLCLQQRHGVWMPHLLVGLHGDSQCRRFSDSQHWGMHGLSGVSHAVSRMGCGWLFACAQCEVEANQARIKVSVKVSQPCWGHLRIPGDPSSMVAEVFAAIAKPLQQGARQHDDHSVFVKASMLSLQGSAMVSACLAPCRLTLCLPSCSPLLCRLHP